MAIYMLQFSYTSEAWAALTKNPQDRSVGIAEAIQGLGGRLLGLYYCFGEYDGVVMVEAPDDTAASAAVLAAVTAGHLKTIRTTKLFTVQETMEMMRKAGEITFRAPSAG
jgi:uncharacterized protein with GYD domain